MAISYHFFKKNRLHNGKKKSNKMIQTSSSHSECSQVAKRKENSKEMYYSGVNHYRKKLRK